ncbi:MAG: hypothetical protein IT161_09710 [Bryobacterales bacterium]|nr:hypothetical protein [Bryobacterales bacterium]
MKRLLVCLPLLLAGCTKIETVYAPPIQRVPANEWAKGRLKPFITMDSPDAMDHVVEQVVPALESGLWRWTLQKPTFQFMLPETKGMKLRVDLTVPELTLKQTGPVTIQFFVQGRLLDRLTIDKPGDHRFLKPVPEDWLGTEMPVVVRLEIDKMWKSPVDGIERGFIVTRLGFAQ